jgi:hypothetical protein
MPAALLPFAASLALPGVWRGDAWAGSPAVAVTSGHAVLDVELPGGGWPTGELIDLLQAPAAQHEWRLLLPALRHAQRHGPLVLVGAPHPPHLAALAAQGVAPEGLWWLDTAGHNERLWAAEQVLRSGTAGAVLVWLPQARPEQLRPARRNTRVRCCLPFARMRRGNRPRPRRCGCCCVARRAACRCRCSNAGVRPWTGPSPWRPRCR